MAVNIESKDPTFDGKEETKMEKKVYETPEVTKVEFDASDRITASGCENAGLGMERYSYHGCRD